MAEKKKPENVINSEWNQKQIQLELDLTYNKFLQNITLNLFLTKLHRNLEQSIDDKLTHFEELYETKAEDEANKRQALNEMVAANQIIARTKLLKDSLEKCCLIIDEEQVIEKINKFKSYLSCVCNKLHLENIEFVETTENYKTLENILKNLSEVLTDLNQEYNNELSLLLQNIFQIQKLLLTIRKNHEITNDYLSKINKLTLNVISMEFTKDNEE